MNTEIFTFVHFLKIEKNASPNTIAAYRQDIVKFNEYCRVNKVFEVGEVTNEHCQAYCKFLEENNWASATISRNIASLKKFFIYLNNEGHISINPMNEIVGPKVKRKEIISLTEDEVTRLLEQPKGDSPKLIRDRAMLELLYATGIKVTELITLKMIDLDMKSGMIVCEDRFKVRRIPFGQKAYEALKNYLYHARDELIKDETMEYVFCNFLGEPMSRQGFWKLIKTYAKEAGIQSEINAYTLRHAFACHLLNNGADIKSVQELLGHLDTYSTKRYIEGENQQLRNMYKKAHPRA